MFQQRPSAKKPPQELYDRFRQTHPALRPSDYISDATSTVQYMLTMEQESANSQWMSVNQGNFDGESVDLVIRDHVVHPNYASSASSWASEPTLGFPLEDSTSPLQYDVYTPSTSSLGFSHVDTEQSSSHDLAFGNMNWPLSPHMMEPFQHQTEGFPNSHHQSTPPLNFQSIQTEIQGPPSVNSEATSSEANDKTLASAQEGLRFRVSLHAATAMSKPTERHSVTYLNKGSTYWITLQDTKLSSPSQTQLKYRTTFRVAFDSAEQLERAAACYQYWQNTNQEKPIPEEGGYEKPAIEYIDFRGPSNSKCEVAVENRSFGRFSITWSGRDLRVALRLNFLSTDLSLSKGAQATAVRLCTETQVLSQGSLVNPEACYCMVKLFRPHGAERKLANDHAATMKSIMKLTLQTPGSSDDMRVKKSAQRAERQQEKKNQELAELEKILASARPVTLLSQKAASGALDELTMNWRAGANVAPRPEGRALPRSIGRKMEACIMSFTSMKNIPKHPNSTLETYPVAYIHTVQRSSKSDLQNQRHHSVCLMRRTIHDVISSVAKTCGIISENTNFLCVDVVSNGVAVNVYDDSLSWIPEGHWIRVEICEIESGAVGMSLRHLGARVGGGNAENVPAILELTLQF